MEGYNCDYCNIWFTGKPASLGYRQYLHHKHRPLETVKLTLDTRVYGSSNIIDLCPDCIMVLLEMFKESHNSKTHNPSTINGI